MIGCIDGLSKADDRLLHTQRCHSIDMPNKYIKFRRIGITQSSK